MKQTRAEWLEERKTYIGASEIAAICGINSYDTPRNVWMVKKGLKVVEDNLPMKIGRLLEDTVAQEFAKAMGIRPQSLLRSGLVRHKKHEYMACNPDRIWKSHPGGPATVQIKTCNQYASADFGPTGTDEVKDEYLVQVAQEMWVCGVATGYLAVLIGNGDFRWYRFTWTDTMIAIMEKVAHCAKEWWFDYYLADVPPPVTGHEVDRGIVTQSYPSHDSKLRIATPEIEDLIKDWPKLAAEYEKLDKEIKRRKNVLREFIADASGVQSPIGEPIAFWKANKNQVRTLRLKFEGDTAA